MRGHLTREEAGRYRYRTLSPEELLAVDDHVAVCTQCSADLGRVAEWRGSVSDWTRDPHLTYEQIAGYVDGRLTGIDRDAVHWHAADCERCRTELVDLQEFARELAGPGWRARLSGWILVLRHLLSRLPFGGTQTGTADTDRGTAIFGRLDSIRKTGTPPRPRFDAAEDALLRALPLGASPSLSLGAPTRERRVGLDPVMMHGRGNITPEERALVERYAAALTRLTPQERAVIVARVEKNVRLQEIAAAFGNISIGEAHIRVMRAFRHLAHEMELWLEASSLDQTAEADIALAGFVPAGFARLDEVEREFQTLVDANPRSLIARRLLMSLKDVRRSDAD